MCSAGLQPSFVPPPQIRQLREFTRLRADLVHERTRYRARLEKLLERALVTISAVLSRLTTGTARVITEALIAGERNPETLAELATGKARSNKAEPAGAPDGDRQPHHSEPACILLDQIDALTAQIDALTGRVSELIEQIPAARGTDAGGVTGPQAGPGPAPVIWPTVARLDEITGCAIIAAQAIIAQTGPDMTVLGAAGRLVWRAERSPQTRQSGTKTAGGRTGKGNPCLDGTLGEIAASASRTGTFPGERYPRLARRRGKRKAQAAAARSVLVIIFRLLAGRQARFRDLGPGWYHTHINAERKTRNLIRQLEAPGHTVTLTPPDAAAA